MVFGSSGRRCADCRLLEPPRPTATTIIKTRVKRREGEVNEESRESHLLRVVLQLQYCLSFKSREEVSESAKHYDQRDLIRFILNECQV